MGLSLLETIKYHVTKTYCEEFVLNSNSCPVNFLDYYTVLQYTLSNPNRGVPIQKISVPITEFVRISEVALIIWRINNTKICGNPLLLI